MSQLGQTRKSIPAIFSSALPSAADIVRSARHVRFVPQPDSCIAAKLFDPLESAAFARRTPKADFGT